MKNKLKRKAIKILLCAGAGVLTLVAALCDNPWLCAPSILLMASAVMVDD